MKLESELAKYIYSYCDLPKMKIDPEINLEIAEAFCTRLGHKFVTVETIGSELALVTIEAHESLQLYSDWRFAYEEHGYSPPLLEIV